MQVWPGMSWQTMRDNWTESQLMMFSARAVERIEKQNREMKRMTRTQGGRQYDSGEIDARTLPIRTITVPVVEDSLNGD